MNHIFYQTKTKYTNTGDALINNVLLKELRKYGKVYANCSESVPEEFLKELGVKTEEKLVVRSEMGFVLAITKCALKNRKDKVYVFSGLGDVHGGGCKRCLKNYLTCGILGLYNLLGIESVRIGRSIGEITKGYAKSEVFRSWFVPYNYVRDTKSLERCKEWGIKNIKLCPDMSWLYMRDTDRRYNEGNTVVINMRASTLGKYDVDYAKKVVNGCGKIFSTLQEVMKEKPKLKFVYQVVEDRQITEELSREFSKEYDVEFVDRLLKQGDFAGIYEAASFHVSNRMHSLLVGYKFGSLPMAIVDVEKHLKIVDTFNDAKLSGLIMDINDERDIIDKTNNIYLNRAGYYGFLIERENCLKKDIDKILLSILSES